VIRVMPMDSRRGAKSARVLIVVGGVAYCRMLPMTGLGLCVSALRGRCLEGTGPVGKRHLEYCGYWAGRGCDCAGALERLPGGDLSEWAVEIGY